MPRGLTATADNSSHELQKSSRGKLPPPGSKKTLLHGNDELATCTTASHLPFSHHPQREREREREEKKKNRHTVTHQDRRRTRSLAFAFFFFFLLYPFVAYRLAIKKKEKSLVATRITVQHNSVNRKKKKKHKNEV